MRMIRQAVYLSGLHAAEVGVANIVKRMISQPEATLRWDRTECANWAEKQLDIRLAEAQAFALMDALRKKFMVITGGPGTGKTTLITAIVRCCNRLGRRIILAAPTGRASKRMTQAADHEASTLHRLLEYKPGEGIFQRNEYNPLDADTVIVDEASMVDITLMHRLLKAIPVRAQLIAVGDADQLPSVGPGNVLRDMIDSGVVPTVRLKAIFRQSKGSMIIVNANLVISGSMPMLSPLPNHLYDCRFISRDDDAALLETTLKLCVTEIPTAFGFDPLTDIQVLSPMHRGTVGCRNLNRELQKLLNPGPGGLEVGENMLKAGDKVLQTENNYLKDVYNGDIIQVEGINSETQEVKCSYEGRQISYDYHELEQLIPAYAISVHKSQGSEYPVVVIPVSMQHIGMLQRNLLYTAITRGKKLVILVGDKRALARAVSNSRASRRFSNLRARLKG